MIFNERSPIYEQIVQHFCRSLVKGELQPAQRIPSIRDLALELKVNTNTVQRAYQEMERRELIYSRRGTGYFIAEGEDMIEAIKKDMVQDAALRFLEEMRSLGFGDAEIKESLTHYISQENENGGGLHANG